MLFLISFRLEKYEAQCTEKSSSSIPVGSENQTSTSASQPPPPASFDQPSTSTPLLGLPAVTIPAHSAKPGPLLHLQVNDCPCLWIVAVLYLL